MPRVKRPLVEDGLPEEMSLVERAIEEKLLKGETAAIEQGLAMIEGKKAPAKELACLLNLVQQSLTQRALRRRYQAKSGMTQRQIEEDPAKAKETVVAYLRSLTEDERFSVCSAGTQGSNITVLRHVAPRPSTMTVTADLDTF